MAGGSSAAAVLLTSSADEGGRERLFRSSRPRSALVSMALIRVIISLESEEGCWPPLLLFVVVVVASELRTEGRCDTCGFEGSWYEEEEDAAGPCWKAGVKRGASTVGLRAGSTRGGGRLR